MGWGGTCSVRCAHALPRAACLLASHVPCASATSCKRTTLRCQLFAAGSAPSPLKSFLLTSCTTSSDLMSVHHEKYGWSWLVSPFVSSKHLSRVGTGEWPGHQFAKKVCSTRSPNIKTRTTEVRLSMSPSPQLRPRACGRWPARPRAAPSTPRAPRHRQSGTGRSCRPRLPVRRTPATAASRRRPLSAALGDAAARARAASPRRW